MANGVDRQQAAASNVSGEFWATTDHVRAEWFAGSHPNSPPAACFEFEVPEHVLAQLAHRIPPGLIPQPPVDYEFLPSGFAILNQHMVNQRIVPIP